MEEFSMPQSILQIVSEKGFDGLREIMQILFNEAMKMERENYLHATRISVRICELTTPTGSNRVPSIRFKARFNCPFRKREMAVFIRPALKKGCAACWAWEWNSRKRRCIGVSSWNR